MSELYEIEEKIKAIKEKFNDGSADRKKCLDQLESLYKEHIKLLRKTPTPVSTLFSSTQGATNQQTSTSSWRLKMPTLALPSFLSGSSKSKEEVEEEQRQAALLEQSMKQLENGKKERREKMLAEQAANNQMILRTSMQANQKKSAILETHRREVEHQLVAEQQREKERETQYEYDMVKMEKRAREESRKLEEERRLAREEDERKNSERREKLAQETAQQEQLTSQLISESQISLDHQAAVNRQKHQEAEKNLTELKEQYSEEREAMLRELRRIDEEVKRSQEECRRKYEEIRRRSEEQLEELIRLLKLAEWSRTIEENWSNRLKALKSTDRRVHRAMGQLRVQLAVAKVKELNVEFIRKEVDRLKTEISEVKRVMDREVDNLQKMYDFSGKHFILDISNSLSNISKVCSELTEYLNSQQSVPKFGNPEAADFYEHIEAFDVDLHAAFSKIPTMSSLKSKYANGFETKEKLAIEDVGSVVQIEEID